MGFAELNEKSRASLDAGLCGCHSCVRERGEMPVRVIVCPECGNKRCPQASNHTLACTRSNEPGQPGSVYE
jgi:hypothetical protein